MKQIRQRKSNLKLIIVYDNGEPYHVNHVESWWVDHNRNITYRVKRDANVIEEYTSQFGDVSAVVTRYVEPFGGGAVVSTVYNYNPKNMTSTLEFSRIE